MPRAIIVNHRECTGCRICESACSIKNEDVASKERSRIRVYPFSPGMDIPVVCDARAWGEVAGDEVGFFESLTGGCAWKCD